MPDIKRRKVVKGISLASVAALSPLSVQAVKPANSQQSIAIYVNARHGQFKHSLANEIINTSHQSIAVNTKQPVCYKHLNGNNIALYVNSPDEVYSLQPGERLSVYARPANVIPSNNTVAQSKTYDGNTLIV